MHQKLPNNKRYGLINEDTAGIRSYVAD